MNHCHPESQGADHQGFVHFLETKQKKIQTDFFLTLLHSLASFDQQHR
jgi:hypothetical protein